MVGSSPNESSTHPHETKATQQQHTRKKGKGSSRCKGGRSTERAGEGADRQRQGKAKARQSTTKEPLVHQRSRFVKQALRTSKTLAQNARLEAKKREGRNDRGARAERQ